MTAVAACIFALVVVLLLGGALIGHRRSRAETSVHCASVRYVTGSSPRTHVARPRAPAPARSVSPSPSRSPLPPHYTGTIAVPSALPMWGATGLATPPTHRYMLGVTGASFSPTEIYEIQSLLDQARRKRESES